MFMWRNDYYNSWNPDTYSTGVEYHHHFRTFDDVDDDNFLSNNNYDSKHSWWKLHNHWS